MAFLAHAGNREEAPDFLAGLRLEGDHLAAPSVVGTEPERHEAARVDRRTGNDLALVARVVAEVLRPDDRARFLIERHRVRRRRAHEDQTLRHGDPLARRRSHAGRRGALATPPALARHGLIAPAGRAALRVDRVDGWRRGDVDHAVDHDRHGARGGRRREALGLPRRTERRDILRRDPGQRRIARVPRHATNGGPLEARRAGLASAGLHCHHDWPRQHGSDDEANAPGLLHATLLSTKWAPFMPGFAARGWTPPGCSLRLNGCRRRVG